MIGLVQALLLDLVQERRGAEGRARALAGAGCPGRTFRLDTDYDDEEWRRLLASSVKELGLDEAQALRAYAQYFLADAERRWPAFFEMSPTARDLLRRQPAIHNCLAAGLRNSEARGKVQDKFRIAEQPDRLITHYTSSNRLCGLYRELVDLVLARYGETARLDECRCQLRGDAACEIHIIWPDGDGHAGHP